MKFSRKVVFAGGAVALTFVGLTAFVLASFLSQNPAPVQTPAPAGSASPAPSLSLSEEALHAFEEEEPDHGRFPIIGRLPYGNRYWRLLEAGPIVNNQIPLLAKVYVKPGEDAQAIMNRQRPQIERWLGGVGQRPGTYTLKLEAEEPHTY